MRFFRLLLAVGVLLVGGMIILVGGIKDKVNLNKPMADLSELAADDLKSGMFVEGTIYEMWDNFAYEKDDSSTREYYAMPLETSFELDYPVFVAIKLGNSQDKAIASRMSKETDDYYIRGKEPAVWTEMQFTGKVHKLKGEMLGFFEDYVEKMGYSTSTSMQPYVISKYAEGNENIRIVIGGVMTGIGLLILGLFVFFGIVKRRR